MHGVGSSGVAQMPQGTDAGPRIPPGHGYSYLHLPHH
jgi:hypothetical protein